jgi:hypothetical protein
LADGAMLGSDIAIVGRHAPVGHLSKGCAELYVLLMKTRLFQVQFRLESLKIFKPKVMGHQGFLALRRDNMAIDDFFDKFSRSS